MLSALFYLQYHSAKNRLRVRLKRLKEPKYFLGALVGGLYFYFYFFRVLFHGEPQAKHGLNASPENALLFELLGALALLLVVFFAWLLPRDRAALTFTEAEIAFLFPAPISREGLIHFKLARSQVSILFTCLLLTIVSSRWGGLALAHGVGSWLLLSTLSLHLTACSFARTMLMDRGISTWRRRSLVLGLAAFMAAGILFWAQHTMPQVNLADLNRIESIKEYLEQLLTSGPLPYLLFPFRLLVRPYAAATLSAFASALVPALLLLVLNYVAVIRLNVSFEEASLEASRRMAETVAAVRSGNLPEVTQKLRHRRAPFRLEPEGMPAVAFLWKNLVSASSLFRLRTLIMLAIVGGAVFFATNRGPAGSAMASALGLASGTLILWTALIGPQFLRQDFRQDLVKADLLKLYPLRGWEIALGEILAPAVILSSVQWLLLLVATLFLSRTAGGLEARLLVAIAISAALLLPLLNLITLLIPNAAVLLFPAWFQLGKDSPHGIEATGQRIIFLFGQLFMVLICLVPAALMFMAVFFLLRLALDVAFVIPIASVLAALLLAAEASLGVLLLGRLFERFDVLASTSN
jgi:ABC-2 type transport system permease protein